MKATDPGEFFASLNAGVFNGTLGAALSAVAGAVVDHGKKGKVVITLDMSRIGESHQVNITHKLAWSEPTKRGSRSEDNALDTPMFVTEKGLQLFADNPTANLFTKQDAPVPAR